MRNMMEAANSMMNRSTSMLGGPSTTNQESKPAALSFPVVRFPFSAEFGPEPSAFFCCVHEIISGRIRIFLVGSGSDQKMAENKK